MHKLLICAVLFQDATWEKPRQVSLQTYRVLNAADSFARSYNDCLNDLAKGKVNYSACREMNKKWKSLTETDGFPSVK